MAAGVVLLGLLVALGITLGLYVLIKRETAHPRVTDRAAAEAEARARGGRRNRLDEPDDEHP